MDTGLPAEGFLRHKGLILAAAGGAVVEGGLLTLVAPHARSVAPQVTAIPSLAAYHDLRWLFTDSQSWPWFAGLVVLVLAARTGLDVLLLRLAWPRGGRPAPALHRAAVSCAALTLVAWLMLTPAATLAFGVAVLPFSWPFLAAFPIMLGMVAALSHGGVLGAWWRRLPPLRAVLWLLGSFVAATVAAAVISRVPAAAGLAVAAAAALVNARAWYGLALVAARVEPRVHESVPAKVVFNLPFAPLTAMVVLVAVAGVARLLFTGAIQLPISPQPSSTLQSALAASAAGGPSRSPAVSVSAATASAVLVVGGWGSSCCDAANGLRAVLPGVPVRQFSYVGLNAKGQPIPSGADADDMALPELGDRIAAQVRALHRATGRPVAVVAESEGTLGVYAMLDRDQRLPISSVVLLSPIVSPGRLSYPPSAVGNSVSEDALNELNLLVGSISPYGPGGAKALLASVSEDGAKYFDNMVSGAATAASDGKPVRWLAVVPLADAVTLPDCSLPPGVIVVPAFHGGLLGDSAVLPMVTQFLSGRTVTEADNGMREAAELITSASAAWRMPETTNACPYAS
jgi:hypothetical protein